MRAGGRRSPNLLKKGTVMRRVIRAFQVEYKNSRKRNRRSIDSSLRLETLASVFGNSTWTGVAEAAGKARLSGHAVKPALLKKASIEQVRLRRPHKIGGLDAQQETSAETFQLEPAPSVEAYEAADQKLTHVVHYDLLIIGGSTHASGDELRRIAERAALDVQPTNPALDELGPAVQLFQELIKTGIPRARLVFALNHVVTDTEAQAAREYLREAGYEVLSDFLPAKNSYRRVQTSQHGRLPS
jgi:hypothetical protein